MKLSKKFVCACLGALLVIAMAAPMAQAAKPAPPYERFVGCPNATESPATTYCLRSVVKGGKFKMGNKDVPISNPIILTGGVGNGLSNFVANSEGGMTHVKQQVPGGVIGLTGLDWLVNFLDIDTLQLFAETEVVGQPQLTFATISLPIRVHLINPVLGSKCYVGSPASPINLNMTVLTTNPPPPATPISGTPPSVAEEGGILKLLNAKYVDNAFAAPGANGCTLTLFGFIPISINGLVNTQSGLPSPAGKNLTEQFIDTEIVPRGTVYP